VVPGVWFYDPAFMVTPPASRLSPISTRSPASCVIAGTRSSSWRRSRPTSKCRTCSINGELPNATQAADWEREITYHTYIHENVRKRFLEGSTTTPTRWACSSRRSRRCRRTTRTPRSSMTRTSCTGKWCASSPRCQPRRRGPSLLSWHAFVYPDNSLGYTQNFLSMMWRSPNRATNLTDPCARARRTLHLHADHEQNCGTTRCASWARRTVTLRRYRRRHRRTLRTTSRRGQRGGLEDARQDRQHREHPSFIATVKEGKAKLEDLVTASTRTRSACDDHQEDRRRGVQGDRQESLLDIALKLEEIALKTTTSSRASSTRTWTSTRSDLSGDGLSAEMFTVLFAIPRTSGWLATPRTARQDMKIARPRQLYVGAEVATTCRCSR